MAKQSVAEQFVGILVRAGVQRLYGCRLGDPVRGHRGRTPPGYPYRARRTVRDPARRASPAPRADRAYAHERVW
ncbi:hypothetical protein OG393_05705 [Streptomyces sp. NBC_01216]|uniref:hypothetical protein n=1 Tax=Streptomyces sp. NBC_01216 TaxID=2903778 RepID=UPI002E10ABFF|nr:hypothetical protein OG393_05705 [Streptomyces sp. NBC_01216]